MQKLKFLLTFWLALTAIGASAQGNTTVGGERMPDQVLMSDGSTVKPIRAITRASSEDYTYTYKGVKYTYISENNYTQFFNTDVHTPGVEMQMTQALRAQALQTMVPLMTTDKAYEENWNLLVGSLSVTDRLHQRWRYRLSA